MRANTKIMLLFSVSILILSFGACFKGETFPIEPVISDPTFQTMGDSAIVSFAFTDGDADLGLSPSDTTGVYAPGSYYYYNIYLDYYEKDDILGWVPGKDLSGDTIRFGYRIKPIEVSHNTKGISGTIDVSMEYYQNP